MKPLPLAVRLGSGPHRSLLLHRAAGLGLADEAALENEALRRGCRHYAPPDWVPTTSPSATKLRNEDLAVCLLHPSLPAEPQRIRLGAAMLGAAGNSARHLAHRSVQERAERIVAEIARAGREYEPHNDFWRDLLSLLPDTAPVPAGVLPHRSRFVILPGRQRPGNTVSQPGPQWIRPVLPAA